MDGTNGFSPINLSRNEMNSFRVMVIEILLTKPSETNRDSIKSTLLDVTVTNTNSETFTNS